jgi:hypothetical protein
MALIEGEDYYIEAGLLVFTRRFHLKRGHCCGSGCRHCPYDPHWTKGSTAVGDLDIASLTTLPPEGGTTNFDDPARSVDTSPRHCSSHLAKDSNNHG